MARQWWWRGAACAAMAAVLAACGSGGKTGAASEPNPNSPVISNLVVHAQGACVLQGTRGTHSQVSLDYADPNGDVAGGELESEVRRGKDFVTSLVSAVPSEGLTLTGTTGGRVFGELCLAAGGATDLTLRVHLRDAAGNRSNELVAGILGLRAGGTAR